MCGDRETSTIHFAFEQALGLQRGYPEYHSIKHDNITSPRGGNTGRTEQSFSGGLIGLRGGGIEETLRCFSNVDVKGAGFMYSRSNTLLLELWYILGLRYRT